MEAESSTGTPDRYGPSPHLGTTLSPTLEGYFESIGLKSPTPPTNSKPDSLARDSSGAPPSGADHPQSTLHPNPVGRNVAYPHQSPAADQEAQRSAAQGTAAAVGFSPAAPSSHQNRFLDTTTSPKNPPRGEFIGVEAQLFDYGMNAEPSEFGGGGASLAGAGAMFLHGGDNFAAMLGSTTGDISQSIMDAEQCTRIESMLTILETQRPAATAPLVDLEAQEKNRRELLGQVSSISISVEMREAQKLHRHNEEQSQLLHKRSEALKAEAKRLKQEQEQLLLRKNALHNAELKMQNWAAELEERERQLLEKKKNLEVKSRSSSRLSEASAARRETVLEERERSVSDAASTASKLMYSLQEKERDLQEAMRVLSEQVNARKEELQAARESFQREKEAAIDSLMACEEQLAQREQNLQSQLAALSLALTRGLLMWDEETLFQRTVIGADVPHPSDSLESPPTSAQSASGRKRGGGTANLTTTTVKSILVDVERWTAFCREMREVFQAVEAAQAAETL
jgi:hypothetical protein